MSESSRQRRLYVTNRLEELRAKHGHEDGWDALAELIHDRVRPRVDPFDYGLQSEATGAGNVGGGTIEEVPLPIQQRSANGGVTPPASPGQTSILSDLGL
jgi:hypothetical protein